ncbi:secretin N-terminal domain-containing protein [Escherichia coli O120:H1]|uniref:secretin N-terminal domain-containing protein n=1 Tax=Escherichia coli TaxID=562 RepID=UPI000BE1D673|nr:secretin N-terminal domain-containing protein [Escherichia coli]CAD5781138.1 lipoprotein [Escherichia coli]CAD5794260.1 lipoprotein [Escherichia coli]
MRIIQKTVAILPLLTLITSCSTDIYKTANKNYNDDKSVAEKHLSSSTNESIVKDTSVVKVLDKLYIGSRSTESLHGEPLPVNLEGANGVSLSSGIPLKLGNIIDLLQRSTGLSIVKKDYVVPASVATSGEVSETEAKKISDALSKALGEKNNNSQGGLQSLLDLNANKNTMNVNYTGPLSVFLNKMASHFDLSWQYSDGQILVSGYEARIFSISTLPNKVQSSNSITSSDSGSGSGSSSGSSSGSGSSVGSTNQTITLDVSYDFWKDLESELKMLIGNDGEYYVSQSTSSVLVKTSPTMMRKVAEYLDNVNKKLERQVSVDVQVYSVSVDDSSQFSLTLNALLRRNGGIFGSVSSDFSSSSGTTLTGFWNSDGNKDNSALISALESTGNVSTVTSSVVTTMSGQPVPVLVGNERTYISEVGTTLNNNTSTTSASTDTVTSGFLMNLLPRIMDNGNILLQYNITLSSLVGANDGFNSVTVGGTTIQLPDIDKRSFIQSSMLKNGSTLVLAGYEQKRNEVGDQGVGSPGFKLLGGKRNGLKSREIMVICITPRVIDVGGS